MLQSFITGHFSCEPCDVFLHTKPVYGLSVDMTNDQVFATAGEDGLVLMFDLRVGTHILALPKGRASFHAVQFHPSDGNTIITANEKDGAALWDLRDSKQLVSLQMPLWMHIQTLNVMIFRFSSRTGPSYAMMAKRISYKVA